MGMQIQWLKRDCESEYTGTVSDKIHGDGSSVSVTPKQLWSGFRDNNMCLKRGRAAPGLAGNVCGKMRRMRILGIVATMANLFRPQMVPANPLVQPTPFYCALTGTTPSSGDLWPLSGGGKWPRDPATEIYISFDLIKYTHYAYSNECAYFLYCATFLIYETSE